MPLTAEAPEDPPRACLMSGAYGWMLGSLRSLGERRLMYGQTSGGYIELWGMTRAPHTFSVVTIAEGEACLLAVGVHLQVDPALLGRRS